MTTTAPTSKAAQRALDKLTRAELDALRVQLRRELRDEKRGTRQPRYIEIPELAAGVARMIRAVGTRVADDPTGLGDLVELGRVVEAQLARAVAGARDPELHRHPYSWADIGRELGTTRQNAQQRFGKAGS